MVIRNPGIPLTSPYLQLASEHGASIEMEIALFFLACPGRIIGITGTRGKTTTTTLIYTIVRESGIPTVLGGNVTGVETLLFLPYDYRLKLWSCLELSSWQLEGLAPHRLSPAVAVMTNIYPDHLNTYNGMEDYAEAKANIFRHQHANDLAVFNYDNPWTRRFGEEAPGEVWFTSMQRGGSFQRGSSDIVPFIFTTLTARRVNIIKRMCCWQPLQHAYWGYQTSILLQDVQAISGCRASSGRSCCGSWCTLYQ